MNRTDISVERLVSMYESGELILPEMQRQYVWRAPRVRDLLDSLYRRYPSGSILVWESSQENPTRESAIEQNQTLFSSKKLLLDGQQRLTSLAAVLEGKPVKVRGRRRAIEILFNLDHPERLKEHTEVEDDSSNQSEDIIDLDDEGVGDLQERLKNLTFVVASKSLSQQPNWVSVTRVFQSESDTEILKAAGVSSWDDPRYDKYVGRLKKLRDIKNYPYVMDVIPETLDYEEVADIFVRVNSLGAKLRGSDLALAQITAKWPGSLKLLEEFQEECEDHGMTIDIGVFVRAMVVFATDQCRFNRVAQLSESKLKQGWEKAKESLLYAFNFLRENAHIEDESLLSSPLFFLTLGYLGDKASLKSKQQQENVLLWLYYANARGRYSRGSTETLLDEDLKTIRETQDPSLLVKTLTRQFGRLVIEPTDFAERGAGSPLFPLVFLALKAAGAQDWETGLKLSLSHQGRNHWIEYHHIFPKSLLKEKFDKSKINEIANLAFISGSTNRAISNKLPDVYLREIITKHGENMLLRHCVPVDGALHKIEHFEEFLAFRRAELAIKVNDFVAMKSGSAFGIFCSKNPSSTSFAGSHASLA